MKSRHSLIALFIAIAIHGIILALLWQTDQIQDDIPKMTKRFGILLGEENILEEQVPKLAPIPAKNIPIAPEQSLISSAEKVSQKDSVIPLESIQSEIKPYTPSDADSLPPSVLHHYGEAFFELSAGEQHYIIDNLQRIRKINEIVGTKLLRERPDDEIDPDDSNIVEFTLYPDGTINDLHLQKNRVGTALDELTLQTINLAHSRYPKPEQKTLIRIRVYILVK